MFQNKFLVLFDVESTDAFNEYAQMMRLYLGKHFHRMDAVVHNHTLQSEEVAVRFTRWNQTVQVSF